MQTKLIALVAGLVAALASLGAGAAGAHSSLGGCPELRTACQPTGDRPVAQQPRSDNARPKVQPQSVTDSQGRSVWRAGRHVMY